MSLSIEIRKIDHVVILELAGRVSAPEVSLTKIADQLIEGGDRYFIINLANVSYLDNSGLGQLCLIYTMTRNRGGDMRLLRPTPRIRRLLNITKLDSVFESFECEASALQSIQLVTTAVSA